MSEILFELIGSRMVPVLPSWSRRLDNVRYFELDAAATAIGLSVDQLEADWLNHFSADEPLADGLGAVSGPSSSDVRSTIVSKARLRALRAVRFAHLTESHWDYLVQDCEQRGLDPGLVYANVVDNGGRKDIEIITTIAAFRQVAQGTGERMGESPPQFSKAEEHWLNVWPDPETPPYIARAFVSRRDHGEPYVGNAYWKFHAQYKPGPDGLPVLIDHWYRGGPHMLGKCALAGAYRAAWPDKFGGLYTTDEIPVRKQTRPTAPTHPIDPAIVKAVIAPPPVDPVVAVADDPRTAWSLVDEGTPDSSRSLKMAIMEAGASNILEAQTIIERFTSKLPRLASEQHYKAFCAVVIRCIRDNPRGYGLAGA